MKEYYQNSLKFKILDRIKQQIDGSVVLRTEIQDMASPRQVSRSLKDLVKMGELVKIGSGVYAKAYVSHTLNRPVIECGFAQACKEALTKKGIKWEPCSAEQAYNAGLSTQVPVRPVIKLNSRYRGSLSYGNRKLIIENGINAK